MASIPNRRSIYAPSTTTTTTSANPMSVKRKIDFNSPAPSRGRQSIVPSTPTSFSFVPPTPSTPSEATPSRLARTRSLENREPMKIFLRIRPSFGSTITDSFLRSINETTVTTAPPKEGRFQFSKILGEAVTQTEVFDTSARPLVSFFLRGGSGILFAHGMTGSGKTYTVHGRTGNETEGILPRSLELIFKSINNAQEASNSWAKAAEPLPPNTVLLDRDWDYEVFVSFMEIYNENVYDLLITPSSSSDPLTREGLTLKDRGENHPPLVMGLTEEAVSSVEEARRFLERGKRNRKIAATQMNQTSSRSHTIFTIKLVRYPRGCPPEELSKKMKYCKLAIVDLAGSERASRTGAAGARLKEASGINLSLMTFGRVLEALRNNQKASATNFPIGTPSGTGGTTATPSRQAPIVVVPYRESKLTRLVQSYFTSGKAVMIANVSPDVADSDETLQVLKFSAMAKELAISEAAPQPLVSASSSLASLTKSTASSSSKRRSGIKRKAEEDIPLETEEPKEKENRKVGANTTTEAQTLLLRQIEELKRQLLAAEHKAASVEASVRDEMVRIMAAKLEEQEQLHTEHIEEQLDLLEEKYERKIEILTRLQEEQEKTSVSRRNRRQRGSIDQDHFSEQENEPEEQEVVEEAQAIVTYSTEKAEAALREAEDRGRTLKEKLRELEDEHQKLLAKYEVQSSIVEEMHQQLRGEDSGKQALVARAAQLEQNLARLQAEQAQNLSALRESLLRESKEIQTGLEAHHQSEIREFRAKLAQERKEKEELQLTLKSIELELNQLKANNTSNGSTTNKIGEKTSSWKKPNIPVLGLHELTDSSEDLALADKEHPSNEVNPSSTFMVEEEEVELVPLPSAPSERAMLKMTDSNPFEDVELGAAAPPAPSAGSLGRKLKLSAVVAAAVAAAKAANPSSPRGSNVVAASTETSSSVTAPASPKAVFSSGASRKSRQPPIQTMAASTPSKSKPKTFKDKIVGVLTPKRFNQANIVQSPVPASPTRKSYQVDVNVEVCGSPVNKATQRFSDLFDSPVVPRQIMEDKETEEADPVAEESEVDDETSPARPRRKVTAKAPATKKAAPASKTATRASKRTTTAKKEPVVAVPKTRGKAKALEVNDDEEENIVPPTKKLKVTKETAGTVRTPMASRLRPRAAKICR